MVHKNKLVIVESPNKVKSIAQYLGQGYEVMASVGHIRDLIQPKYLPAELKKGSLGKFSVDVESNFEPYYVIADEKKKTVTDLKKALKNADELLLATDEDREGEAIAWHLVEVLKPKIPVKRMVFHEITKDAIEKACENTRDINIALVDAQETRRILDRLYGFEVSPVLWRKIGAGLSAGRVQSAATRLIVERERERRAFVSAEYWGMIAQMKTEKGEVFQVKMTKLAHKKVATGKDYNENGVLISQAVQLNEVTAHQLLETLNEQATTFRVKTIDSKPYTRKPAAPFITSTLQQEAARKLRFSARQTMSVAQSLYENGYITYMRTDSTFLSQQAISAARKQAEKLYGRETIPDQPRIYASKNKNAQEAHEAIRPSGEDFRAPSSLEAKKALSAAELKLYDLIWKRTLASQMLDAKGTTASVVVQAQTEQGTYAHQDIEFSASGTVLTFKGFLHAYEESLDDEAASVETTQSRLPLLEPGQPLEFFEGQGQKHETAPAPRYTEASLVKKLEELGIGRPSTFASIISTIVDRGYVSYRSQALVPSWVAFSVVKLLENYFGDLVEYDFTAAMESHLDSIARGEVKRQDWLTTFYFGDETHTGLRNIVDNMGEIDARSINSVEIDQNVTLRIGRYGPYLEILDESEQTETPRRVNLPSDLAPDELTVQKAWELIEAPVVSDRVIGVHPETGKTLIVKDGRFGPYITEELSSADDSNSDNMSEQPQKKTKKTAAEKPRSTSLFKTMDIQTVTLEEAVQLLSLPRQVGQTETGEKVYAQNGRYGPYLTKGKETRALTDEEKIFSITMQEALDLFAQPKYASRRVAAALKEFDELDPVSEKTVRIKDGRFGPYVTDGTTNATIPKGESVEDIDFNRAVELLAIKREKVANAPAKTKKTATKKTTAKKAPAKKTSAKKESKSTVKPADSKPSQEG